MPVISRFVESGMGMPYHFATQCHTMRETTKPVAVFRHASVNDPRRDCLDLNDLPAKFNAVFVHDGDELGLQELLLVKGEDPEARALL